MHNSDEGTSSSSESDDAKKPCGWSGLRVFTMLLCLFGIGVRNMTYSTTGVALADLLQVTNSTMYEAGIPFPLYNAGFVFGASLVRYCFCHGKALVATFAMFALAVSTALVPATSSFVFLVVMVTLQGVSSGMITVALLAIVIELCGEKYREQGIQVYLAFKACGPIFAPLILRPFLSKELTKEGGWNSTIQLNNTSDVMTCLGNCSQQRWSESHVLYGYAVLSILCFLLFVSFFVVYILDKCLNTKTVTVAPSQSESRNLKAIFSSPRVIAMTVILFINCVFLCGAMELYIDFITIFCIDPTIGIPKAEAVFMTSVFYCGLCLGRLNAACWLSNILTSFQIIVTSLVGLGIIFIPMCLWADKSKILLWVFDVYFGFLFGPIVPCILSMSLKYIGEDPITMAVPMVGDATSALIFPPVMSVLFVTIGPMTLMYLMCGCIMASLVLTICLYPLIRHSPLHDADKDTELVAILDKNKSEQ